MINHATKKHWVPQCKSNKTKMFKNLVELFFPEMTCSFQRSWASPDRRTPRVAASSLDCHWVSTCWLKSRGFPLTTDKSLNHILPFNPGRSNQVQRSSTCCLWISTLWRLLRDVLVMARMQDRYSVLRLLFPHGFHAKDFGWMAPLPLKHLVHFGDKFLETPLLN